MSMPISEVLMNVIRLFLFALVGLGMTGGFQNEVLSSGEAIEGAHSAAIVAEENVVVRQDCELEFLRSGDFVAPPQDDNPSSPSINYEMPYPRNYDDNPYNGYWQPDRGWIPGMITNATWMTPHPQYSYGAAVYYAPWLMRATAVERELSLFGYLDGVSLLSPTDIGNTVWLKRPGHDWEGPFLVVDCAQRNHMFAAAYYNGEVVEVGFDTALEWGMVRWGGGQFGWSPIEWKIDGVEVWVGDDPPDANVVDPVYYPQWFVDMMRFAAGPWE